MKILYLRLLYALNLKAGGSVGHTAGVINALSKVVDLKVYSNDNLAEVDYDINIIRPIFKKLLPIALKEILLNLQFLFSIDIKKMQPEAIYQRHTQVSFLGAHWAKKYKIPLVLEYNSSELWKLENWKEVKDKRNILSRCFKNLYYKLFLIPFIRWNERFNLDNASLIVVVSDVLRNNLIEMGVPENKILANPNGVDVNKFAPNVGGYSIREMLKIEDKTVLGFIGTFGQWHGVEELANAIVRFFEDYPQEADSVRFLLIGNGILFENVRDILVKGNCIDKVILTGLIPQQDAPKYLDACDILISPHKKNADGTKFFGSPTKLFEYMAMGKGIIASDLDQIGDILEDGITARLVEPDNIEQLKDAMFELIENKTLVDYMGNNARNEVEKKYTWDAHVNKIINKLTS